MWSRELLGTDVYHIIHWFFLYSILGWIVESIYMSFCNKKLTNRGFMKGPMCPIYGQGALMVYFILRPVSNNYVLLYFAGAVLATVFEYIVGRIMVMMFGSFWWDYENKPFNYKGILCLESTVAWGFYTLFLFLFLHKFVMTVVNSYSYGIGIIIGRILIVYFIIDFTISLLKAIYENRPKVFDNLYESIRGRFS